MDGSDSTGQKRRNGCYQRVSVVLLAGARCSTSRSCFRRVSRGAEGASWGAFSRPSTHRTSALGGKPLGRRMVVRGGEARGGVFQNCQLWSVTSSLADGSRSASWRCLPGIELVQSGHSGRGFAAADRFCLPVFVDTGTRQVASRVQPILGRRCFWRSLNPPCTDRTNGDRCPCPSHRECRPYRLVESEREHRWRRMGSKHSRIHRRRPCR